MAYANGRSIPRLAGHRNRPFPSPANMVRNAAVPNSSENKLSITDYDRVPDNVRFEIDDIEAKEWSWLDNYFDYIHSRYMCASISSWPRLVRKSFQ